MDKGRSMDKGSDKCKLENIEITRLHTHKIEFTKIIIDPKKSLNIKNRYLPK